jgi:hypothetical protein
MGYWELSRLARDRDFLARWMACTALEQPAGVEPVSWVASSGQVGA